MRASQLIEKIREYFNSLLVICRQMFLRIGDDVENDPFEHEHFLLVWFVVAQSEAVHFQFQNVIHHLEAETRVRV